MTTLSDPLAVGEATQATTIYFFQPQWMQGDSAAPVYTRVGIHVYTPGFTREQLTAISDRACKVLPEAYPIASGEHDAGAQPVVLHYGANEKVLHVDVPTGSTGVRAVLDAPGAQGSAALFSVVRGLRALGTRADAMVLLFKHQDEAQHQLTARSPSDVSAVIKDAVKAVDVAVYTDVDLQKDDNLKSFFQMLK